MQRVTVTIPATATSHYPILINSGWLNRLGNWLAANQKFSKIVIITDSKVKTLYAQAVAEKLSQQGYSVSLLSFPEGEKAKNSATKQKLETQMLRQRCGRDSVCLALGGGVVGDMAGFVAATYMRGIPYIQVPTTLLAMVDSSVGGKTAIDTKEGKNLIGAFWQPQAVLADIDCLKTLSKPQLINGLIEAFKMFLTSDAQSLRYAEKNLLDMLAGNPRILKNIIYRAVSIKAEVVKQDEKENNLRMILNFGHTIGHALEQLSNYKILHGFAVALGILVEAKIAQLLGFLSEKNLTHIQAIFSRLGIDGKDLKKYSAAKIIRATKLDKKAKSGTVNYVLLEDLGKVYAKNNLFAHGVPDSVVRAALMAYCRG